MVRKTMTTNETINLFESYENSDWSFVGARLSGSEWYEVLPYDRPEDGFYVILNFFEARTSFDHWNVITICGADESTEMFYDVDKAVKYAVALVRDFLEG